jgi:hypothetical protein
MIDVWQALNIYMSHIGEEPARWLPIMGWVYSTYEWCNLVRFWKRQQCHHHSEIHPQLLRQQDLTGYRYRLISVILIGLLSGAYLATLLFKCG